MRLVIAAALASFVAQSGPALAQSAPLAQLAPGEVLLEIEATGQVRVPADKITLLAALEAQGPTAADARQALEKVEARVVSAARGAGVAATDIDTNPPATRIGFVGNEAADPGTSMVFAPNAAARILTSLLEVRLRDASQVGPVRAALERAGAANVQGPIFSLSDDGEARRRAKADAIRSARVEAKAYAEASGMRVARLLRISERAPSDAARLTAQGFMQMLTGGASGKSSQVEVRTVIGVDFALAPN